MYNFIAHAAANGEKTAAAMSERTRECDSALVWRYRAAGESGVECQILSAHDCAEEALREDCSYVMAVFLATLESSQGMTQEQQQRTGSSSIQYFDEYDEDDDEEDKEADEEVARLLQARAEPTEQACGGVKRPCVELDPAATPAASAAVAEALGIGEQAAFATLPRVQDGCCAQAVSDEALAAIGGGAETCIGPVCIQLHVADGKASSVRARAAAFDAALKMDSAWSLPHAAQAACLEALARGGADAPVLAAAADHTLGSLVHSKLLSAHQARAAQASSSASGHMPPAPPPSPPLEEEAPAAAAGTTTTETENRRPSSKAKPHMPLLALGPPPEARQPGARAAQTDATRKCVPQSTERRPHTAATTRTGRPALVPKLALATVSPADRPGRNTRISSCSGAVEDDRNGGEGDGGIRRYQGVLSEVVEGLYVTGEAGAQDAEQMRALGVERVLNVADAVCHECHPGAFAYQSLDLVDNGAREDLRPLFLRAVDFIARGRTVLHCQQGVSRSAALAVAFVMWKRGVGFRRALDFVTRRRPVVSPNGGFIGQLLAWEEYLADCRGARAAARARLLRVVVHPGSRHEPLLVAAVVPRCSRDALDCRGCFLLHCPAERCVRVWCGEKCVPRLRAGAGELCALMREHLWVRDVCEEQQGRESAAFWAALGDKQGPVGTQRAYDRDYEPPRRGAIHRFAAWDEVVRPQSAAEEKALREQGRRQVWVYYREAGGLEVAVPPRFVLRGVGRDVQEPAAIAELVGALFCDAAGIPHSTPVKLVPDAEVLLDEWLATITTAKTTTRTATEKVEEKSD